MKLHFIWIAILLLIAVIYAEPAEPADCGQWSKPIGFVGTAWTAAQMCDAEGWKYGTTLLHALSMGAQSGLYPWDRIGEPSCIAFVMEIAEEADKKFREVPQACENVNRWLSDPGLRDRLLWLGLVD